MQCLWVRQNIRNVNAELQRCFQGRKSVLYSVTQGSVCRALCKPGKCTQHKCMGLIADTTDPHCFCTTLLIHRLGNPLWTVLQCNGISTSQEGVHSSNVFSAETKAC